MLAASNCELPASTKRPRQAVPTGTPHHPGVTFGHNDATMPARSITYEAPVTDPAVPLPERVPADRTNHEGLP